MYFGIVNNLYYICVNVVLYTRLSIKVVLMENFKPTHNRTTLISNEVMEVNRYNLKLNAHKLLIGLAQSIDHTIDMFGDLEIDINGIFKYLEIEERNDRYTIVRDSLFNITENPLQKKISDKKWSSIPWMSVEYDEDDSRFVKIRFDDKVKPYLLELKEYTTIKGLYIAKLGGAYATWLYTVMKMIQTKYHGRRDISIQRLKEYTFTDSSKDHPAYNTAKSATNNFLKKVIGVQWNTKTKSYDIVKNSPLYEINERTDIQVSVSMVKEGKKYVAVSFYVVSKYYKEQQKALTDKSKYVTEIPKEGIQAMKRVPLTTVYANAKAQNMTVAALCEKFGYIIKDGYAEKKMTKEEYEKKIVEREKDENKRAYGQKTIFDYVPDSVKEMIKAQEQEKQD